GRVLIRIVLWWSVFTALTGCVWSFSHELLPGVMLNGFVLLLVIRFLFGAGEAGALPNTARVISCWFPPGKRGPPQALISTCAQVGGATAPADRAVFIQTPYVGRGVSVGILGGPGRGCAGGLARGVPETPASHHGAHDARR